MKKLIYILVCCLCISILFINGCDQNIDKNNDTDLVDSSTETLDKIEQFKIDYKYYEAQEFIKQFILDTVSQNLPDCLWSEETKTFSGSNTDDYNSDFNGWLFELITGEVETGYIQIVYLENEWYVGEYSFSEVTPVGDLTVQSNRSEPLRYLGNSIYCEKKKIDNEWKLVQVNTDEMLSKERAKDIYDEFISILISSES